MFRSLPDEVGSKQMQSHLRNVYATVTLAMSSAAIGGTISFVTRLSVGLAFVAGLADILLILWLFSVHHSPETVRKRLLILLSAGFCSGISLGPLLGVAVAIKPQLIVTAVALTATTFAGFTAAALFSKPGKYLHIGGICMSALGFLTIGSLVNIFFRSSAFFTMELYIGLAIFCGFIVYDTQAIIVKRMAGDTDFIAHALDLFMDAIGVFRHILVILLRREDQDDRRRRRRND